jgi:hypothetical protein
MTDEPNDAEAIAALDAFYPSRDAFYPSRKAWDGSNRELYLRDMRRALDAASAHRRAQSPSELADDARKIAEALRKAIALRGLMSTADVLPALSLAESLLGKIEAIAALAKARD